MCLTDATGRASAATGLPAAGRSFPADAGAIPAPRPSTAAEALAYVRAGLGWLASADAAGLMGAERAECLHGLARAESAHLAATSRILQAFDSAEDYTADGQGGPRTWLAWQTRATRPAAAAAMAWARRLAARPVVAGALAAGSVSVSYARRICDWLNDLPAGVQAAAEDILVQAAAGGAEIGDLAGLFEEIRARTAPTPTARTAGSGSGGSGWTPTTTATAACTATSPRRPPPRCGPCWTA